MNRQRLEFFAKIIACNHDYNIVLEFLELLVKEILAEPLNTKLVMQGNKLIELTPDQYEMLVSFLDYHAPQIEDEGLEDYANDKLWNGMMQSIRSAESD